MKTYARNPPKPRLYIYIRAFGEKAEYVLSDSDFSIERCGYQGRSVEVSIASFPADPKTLASDLHLRSLFALSRPTSVTLKPEARTIWLTLCFPTKLVTSRILMTKNADRVFHFDEGPRATTRLISKAYSKAQKSQTTPRPGRHRRS
jgi:hypothetical protein